MNENIINQNCLHNSVIDCSIKDESGLNDFQKLPSMSEISIPRVGIERFRIPIKYKYNNNEILSHDALASMFVYLEAEKTGVNMSRFCQIIQEENSNSINKNLKTILDRFSLELRDDISEKAKIRVELVLEFSICLKQISLESNNWGYQYYPVKLEAKKILNEYFLCTTLEYEYSSTCPCSLSMSKQYEEDFKAGINTDGNGIATAHGQRSKATVEIYSRLNEQDLNPERIIDLLRIAIPTETQSLVKRQDEQAFAIINGMNPMFVEHAIRKIDEILSKQKNIIDWKVKVEHFESLHSHNAVAYSQKNKNI